MNNLEYYKNKKDSKVIKYLKEYNLYNDGNFNSDSIKLLICFIIKDNTKRISYRNEMLKKVLNELFENYKYDKCYEKFHSLLNEEKESKCNSIVNFNILENPEYLDINAYSYIKEFNPLFITCFNTSDILMKTLINHRLDIQW
ncbi:hypothetical protein BCR36DRAFT_455308 [Piromyces finnis]|uniref:Uncharacterized protein n=1 Tax=Piromyces finnis TaxID=1754191 RepID=A0A1Y1V4A7_9FUNG|nr:hypothetical protein BCR36DRAFT_455308 [Piromyces finnis]|eukprot:ORX46918.1 hypothetical protein BCR36DRAFT_455308 [Piromyces finnis]